MTCAIRGYPGKGTSAAVKAIANGSQEPDLAGLRNEFVRDIFRIWKSAKCAVLIRRENLSKSEHVEPFSPNDRLDLAVSRHSQMGQMKPVSRGVRVKSSPLPPLFSNPISYSDTLNLITMGEGYFSDGLDVKSDRKSTRLNSSHSGESRMPSSA